MFVELLILLLVVVVGLAALAWFAIRQRQMQLWLPSYLWPRPEDSAARHDIACRVRLALASPRKVENATNPTELASVETGHCTTSETGVVQKPENHRGKLGGVCGNVPRVGNHSQAEPVDVFLAICDHYEPRCYGASHDTAIARVDRWCAEYPRLFGRFRDSGGRAPQHTFFFPQDEYHPDYLDRLAELCAEGWGDVDIHLHHDGDTAESLREKLESFRDTLYHRHGLLRRGPTTGEIIYGFIHGNWALCNCRPDGRWCGVDQELTVLRETGCYADFTLPSAPTDTQTRTVNSIYYATDIPGQTKSHDAGVRARVGQRSPREHLLMIQGPLELDWSRRKFGLIPRIENADIHDGFAPTRQRLQLWLKAGVHVAGQPNWLFVKLHTHGCKDGNIDTLLGEPTVRFHEDLARVAAEHPNFRYHYVTAWEMAQLVHAAEQKKDWQSVLSPAERRDPMAESR